MNERNFKHEFTSISAIEHRPFVSIIAKSLMKSLPSNIDFDELVQWGMLGLLDALKKWDPSRPNKFKTYAEFRIRGAMLDGLRGQDQTSRSARDKLKKIEKANRDLEIQLNRKPKRREVAEHLGITLKEFDKIDFITMPISEMPSHIDQFFTADDRRALLISAQNKGSDMESKIGAYQKLNHILIGADTIDRCCFLLYHVWGLSLEEIGECFGVTQSRISQRLGRFKEKAWAAMGDKNG